MPSGRTLVFAALAAIAALAPAPARAEAPPVYLLEFGSSCT